MTRTTSRSSGVLGALSALVVLAFATPARADVAGNGDFSAQVVANTLSASGNATFAAGTHDVFGTSVDLATSVGSLAFTATAQTIFSIAHGTFTLHVESTTPGLLAFDGVGELVCNPNCVVGTGSFVGKVTSVSGSVVLPAALYTFDGTVNLSLGSGTGTFALNAFQECPLPAGDDVEASCGGTFQNTVPPGAEQSFAVDAFFSQVPEAGFLVVEGLSNAGGDLPAGLVPLSNPAAFIDVSTTVTTSGSIEICLHYDDQDHDGIEDTAGVDAIRLKLLHRSSVDGAFVDVTEDVDVPNARVCGFVSSLSPFLLAVAPCRDEGDCDDGDPCTTDVCTDGECSNPPIPDCTTTTTTEPTTTTIESTTTTTTTSPFTTTTMPSTTITTTSTTTTTCTTITTSTTTTTTVASTTTTATSTTTTTQPSGCTAAPTFESILCRLDALIAQVAAATDLGTFQSPLLNELRKARARVQTAAQLTDGGRLAFAHGKLKNAGRWLLEFEHRLRSHTAHQQLSTPARSPLIDAVRPITADVRTLIRTP